jgi:hypothetical protein
MFLFVSLFFFLAVLQICTFIFLLDRVVGRGVDGGQSMCLIGWMKIVVKDLRVILLRIYKPLFDSSNKRRFDIRRVFFFILCMFGWGGSGVDKD